MEDTGLRMDTERNPSTLAPLVRNELKGLRPPPFSIQQQANHEWVCMSISNALAP